MNFVRYFCFGLRIPRTQLFFNLLILLLSICLVGCSNQVRLPSAEQLAEFENAGPVPPTVDMDRLVRAKIGGGLYRVVLGDVLELTMPTILQVVTAERLELPEKISPFTPYLCRVSESGSITLPIVGQIEVAGKSLAEIESAIIDVYHPKYVGTRPSVLARIAEYKTAKVSITGAVEEPGVYELRSDQMSLVALLMEAGGIVEEGATRVCIIHANQTFISARETSSASLSTSIEKQTQDDEDRAKISIPIKFAAVNNSEQISLSPGDDRSDEIKVELVFKPLKPLSTKGQLIVKFDERVQLFTNCDVANVLHRRMVVKLLKEKYPRFSTVRIEPELLALAQQLEAVSAPGSIKGIVKTTNVASDWNPNESRSERKSISDDVLYKQLFGGLASKGGQGQQRKPLTHNSSEPIVLPVRGLNIPFADVALQEGDSAIVERLTMPMFTVIGLVNKPGNFPYLPDVQYNLTQALGFAGGLDRAAEPRYATVYRLKPDGGVVHATFGFRDKSGLTAASNVLIKPGDIVAVEHTLRTRTKAFLDRVFRINLGVYVPLYMLQNR